MKNLKKEAVISAPFATAATAERRRLGRIIHDDRGCALVEWVDAPAGYERPQFTIEGEPSPQHGSGTTIRRDLRKLSEWIKMMRELEDRKRRGED